MAEKTLTCRNNHNYDISREGYVNLLLPNMKNSPSPGDSAEMIRSRNSFLSKGFYSRLPELLCSRIAEFHSSINTDEFNILDAGCGEGYVLSELEKRLHTADGKIKYYGIDISKNAVKTAAKRNNPVSYAVAGIFNMPVPDRSINCLLNIFAPSPAEEFKRVLADEGLLIHVYPGERHLHSLREKLFTDVAPLFKEDKLAGPFSLRSTDELMYSITINGRENIADLVRMTPYSWKTSQERINRFISETDILETSVHFIVSIYGNKL